LCTATCCSAAPFSLCSVFLACCLSCHQWDRSTSSGAQWSQFESEELGRHDQSWWHSCLV
jgi:hypothetical protein